IAHLGSWEWDLATGSQVWSEEAVRIFGIGPDVSAPTFQTLLQAVHPADRADFDRAVHEALGAGMTFSVGHRLRLPDGTERRVHQQGEVRFDKAGNKIRMVAT